MESKLFKAAFSLCRENSDEIYKSPGFKDHSIVTEYYVHPNNYSKTGTTTLSQPIAEGAVLFAEFLKNNINGGLYLRDKNDFYMEFSVPEDWKNAGVFDSDISLYKVLAKDDFVMLCAYNKNNTSIKSNTDNLLEHYKICVAFAMLAARDFVENNDIRNDFQDFLKDETPGSFAVLCEDFYQTHKFSTYNVHYHDIKVKKESYQKIDFQKDTPQTKSEEILIQKFSFNEFSIEQKALIPNLSGEFQLDSGLVNICNAVVNGDVKTVLLHGPAGTGKTVSCKLICQNTGLPVMETVNCTENLDEFILGKFIPCGSEIVFKESFVTKAIREGGAVVFEEINFAKPQYLSFLNSLLDDNGFVRLDNGEVVKRHKNFRFFATMNIGYFGTKQLNQALYNRFNVVVEIAQLSDSAVERMLVCRVPECKKNVKKILNAYHKIKKKIEAEELDIVISPRNLENWARLAKYEGYAAAAEKTIIPVAKCDRLLEKTLRSIIEVFKWD